jgi:DHA1 family inner membrane transport protein
MSATIVGCFIGLIMVLAALSVLSSSQAATIALLVVWGGLAFALVSPLQIWVVDAATDAPNLASTLNQGAFNLGNAIGAGLGGAAIAGGFGYARLPMLGALVASFGLTLVLANVRADAATAVLPPQQ